MKKILLTILASMSIIGANAQNEDDSVTIKTDTSKEKKESMEFKTESGKFVITFYPSMDTSAADTTKRTPKEPELRKFWSGIDLGFNGYLAAGSPVMSSAYSHFDYNQGKSIYWGFNLFEKGIPLYKNKVALVTGLGIDYNNYRFSNNVNPFSLPDSTGKRAEKNYVTNRLKTFYATAPLLLAFDFSKKKEDGFRVALGVVGGVRFFSYTKEKIAMDGDIIKMNTRSDLGLNPFRVNAHARVSYGGFTLFASYALTPMFKNQGTLPEVYPFQFGISLGS